MYIIYKLITRFYYFIFAIFHYYIKGIIETSVKVNLYDRKVRKRSCYQYVLLKKPLYITLTLGIIFSKNIFYNYNISYMALFLLIFIRPSL